MTLCFFLYPILVFLKTLVTTSYASLVYYALHMAFPNINDAKEFIISRVDCKYTRGARGLSAVCDCGIS